MPARGLGWPRGSRRGCNSPRRFESLVAEAGCASVWADRVHGAGPQRPIFPASPRTCPAVTQAWQHRNCGVPANGAGSARVGVSLGQPGGRIALHRRRPTRRLDRRGPAAGNDCAGADDRRGTGAAISSGRLQLDDRSRRLERTRGGAFERPNISVTVIESTEDIEETGTEGTEEADYNGATKERSFRQKNKMVLIRRGGHQ